MRTRIYWFSGTGNSLYAARTIAEGLPEDVKVLPMASVVEGACEFEECDRLGLVFPVYAWGPPLMVQRFIRQMPVDGITSVFAVATYAAMPGAAMSILDDALSERSLRLDAAYGVKMPENYPPMGGPPKLEKQERLLADAEDELAKITSDLQAQEPRGRKRPNPVFRLLGKIANPLFQKSLRKADRKFYADDSCNHCGVCAKVCPVGDIELHDGRPHWRGRCEQCFACLHWCPQEAIQYGRRSVSQPRYHHPDTAVEDFQFVNRFFR